MSDAKINQSISSAQRDSNIELYRIISMILIIAHHYVVNSGLTDPIGPIYSNTMSFPSLFLLIFGAWGKIGINCFVLITGYFMCKSQITAKKFAKLFLEVMFYRIVINAIFWITGYAPFSLKGFIKVIIPFTSVAQNFTGTFLLFFLFIPFLNILIKNLTEKQHVKLILMSALTYVFFGTIPFFSVTMNYVSWYMVLYFIASYVRLYPKKFFDSKKVWTVMTLISVALSIISVVVCSYLGTKLGRNLSYMFVTDANTFLAVLTGFSSFMLFKNIKIKYSKIINTVSATTFGILLIHANGETMRQWLWRDILNNVEMYDSAIMPIHAIASVLIIFIVCSLIDLLRTNFIEKPFFKLWDKRWPKISDKYNSFENRICEKLKINQ